MSISVSDLDVLQNLAIALGIFRSSGEPNPDWFSNPEVSLRNILANEAQREALIAFVDDAMGGADRTTDPTGVIWLPIMTLEDPDLTVAATISDLDPNEIHIGVGISVRTTSPTSNSSLSIPLFRAQKEGAPPLSSNLLLGSSGGHIRVSTAITIDEGAPVPGVARLGAVGLDVDVPTASGSGTPIFGLSLTDFQLPGANSPSDIRVAADNLNELDDAVLDLVLSLVKTQADSATDEDSPIVSIAGLLGLRSGDSIPDFPITQLSSQGPQAIATWLQGVMTATDSRQTWIGYLAALLNGTATDNGVAFRLGTNPDDAGIVIALRVDTGPTGNTLLTPTLSVDLGDTNARAEARADLLRIDLVTGASIALPQFGIWAAQGSAVNPVLEFAGTPSAHADTLRVGFALDTQRRLTFVLAADGVNIGGNSHGTLDLTSADALMEVAQDSLNLIAEQLLAQCGAARGVVERFLGLHPPTGVEAVNIPDLMSDPVETVSNYWSELIAAPEAMKTVLSELRDAVADSSEVVDPPFAIPGTGTELDPWRVILIKPFQLEVVADVEASKLVIRAALVTRVDTLAHRCTVVETRFAATLAEIDFSSRSANLLPGMEASLLARERGVNPPRVMFPLGDGATVTASSLGLRLGWTPVVGLRASIEAPDLTLSTGAVALPITFPVIGPDGTVDLPSDAWDIIEILFGYLGMQTGGFIGDVVNALGWTTDLPVAGGIPTIGARLRLADVVNDPETALRDWLPRLMMSDVGPQALSVLADLFGGSGPNHGFVQGTGHPDDPYRFAIGEGFPNFAIWFPPAGLEPGLVGAPETLQRWRPGDPGFSAEALAACIAAEAGVAADVRALIGGRDVVSGLAAIAQRWAGGDGLIVPPSPAPPGIFINRSGYAAGQLIEALDLENLTGRIPTTTVFVALGANAWLQAPSDRRVDLTAPGLEAAMFTPPAAATGDWFVALANRADARTAGSSTDGTPEQAERLKRILQAIAAVSNDIVLVAVAGAGHAARLAAQDPALTAVTECITLGTPLAPISLTEINTQPTADALRLLHRLLPTPMPADPTDPDADREDEDLALGRALVNAMMELVDRPDPSAELRPPAVPPEPPRSGLASIAVFGTVSDSQVSRAITAIVASGLAERARLRAFTPLPDPTGMHVGIQFVIPDTSGGALSITGDALLTLFALDRVTGANNSRHLRARLRVSDRTSWLTSSPDLELRMLSADLSVPLDGSSAGEATVTLHDGRVFGQSWERLALGTSAGNVPVLPEARVLLSAAIQRITADAAGTASAALADLLRALGIIGAGNAVIGDAIDQLIHDPGGLLRQRLVSAQTEIANSLAALQGSLGTTVDLAARSIRIKGGSDTSGRFGWHADVLTSSTGLSGQVRFGPAAPSAPAGGFNAIVDLNPLQVVFEWRQPGGMIDRATLWPGPEPASLGRMLVKAGPSLAGNTVLEAMRQADETARSIIDAVLDALGLLQGTAGEAERAIYPLAGFLADPAGWLRSSGSLAASPVKIQALLDAMRPLLGLAEEPGSPLVFAEGIQLEVSPEGSGTRLKLQIDPTKWTEPAGIAARLAAGLDTSLIVAPSGPPALGLDVHAGLTGAPVGRNAIHVQLGSGAQLFLRPATGNDIPLIPFAGLGGLANAAAQAALPYLLEKLSEVPGTVGDLVKLVGDALGLRGGEPRKFDTVALHAWALDPVGSLRQSVPTIVSTQLSNIAAALQSYLPAGINVSSDDNSNILSLTKGGVAIAWEPSSEAVALTGDDLSVPGVDSITFVLRLKATGIENLTATIGPAAIPAGTIILRPFATVAAGLNPSGGRRVAVGLAVDELNHSRFAARWLLETNEFHLVASDGAIATAVDTIDPAQVALRLVEVIADLVAAVAMAQQSVQDLLNQSVHTSTVRSLMRGVVLEDQDNPTELIDGLFNPAQAISRVRRLLENFANAQVPLISNPDVIIAFQAEGANGPIGLRAELRDRFELLGNGITLWLENDDRWIENSSGEGLFAGFLRKVEDEYEFAPSLKVNGVGLRIGKSSGLLLDFGVITLETIALHTFAEIDSSLGIQGGGLQLQFSNLAISIEGAGGTNGIAQGILRDSGPTPPKPAFSPALAIQQRGDNPVSVTLRAGDGAGPWWIAIQKGFGPLYLEQIGFGATNLQGRVQDVSILMDGSVSMFGLTCAVDDLQITYLLANGNFFEASSWEVDLAGLAVSADIAGVSIVGGLLKHQSEDTAVSQKIEYLGMLLGRFGVYGITIFGGYGEGTVNQQTFTAFFAVGAVNGPIGGPPAFFLTGIGGGFGINRQLVVPSGLADFGDYPLIQALDIAAEPQDPMAQLRALGEYFPMARGTFWFAAGLSFTSFALVDGIAVVAVQIGDGLDINLLGLARMALPRPGVALVSIEIALLVRFSSSEGVLWVQGQLTDNSWLLSPDIKLTGGFAFVIWFKGEHAGEFVLTMGGYHPDFHRDGYPVVPRIGARWSIGSTIVIKAGGYFALTSEALMAGGDFEASADFGWAWAEVKFGAHGIIFFDPFYYDVSAYARVSAGVTIDTWLFGEITITVSKGARIRVTGPEFHGIATFDVGPVELDVEFGGSDRTEKRAMGATDFIAKYLEAGPGGGALAHALMTSFGAQPSKAENSTPDGSAARPFVVVAEFGLTFTSTVPAVTVNRTQPGPEEPATTPHAPRGILGVAPMNAGLPKPTITLTWQYEGQTQPFPFTVKPRPFGSFPAGVWGPPQDPNNRKVPKAEMIEALNELTLEALANPTNPGPAIPYFQVEIGERKPLPFARRASDVEEVKSEAAEVDTLVTQPTTVKEAFDRAREYLGVSITPTGLASLRGERQAPPRLGTLTEGLQADPLKVIPVKAEKPPAKVYDHFVDPPVAVGILPGTSVDIRIAAPRRTTVSEAEGAWRTAPPTLALVEAKRSRSIATRLVIAEPEAVSTQQRATVIGNVDVPPTSLARGAPAIVARTGAPGFDQLNAFTSDLVMGPLGAQGRKRKRLAAQGTPGATLTPGQLVVLKLPNAKADAALEGERPKLAVSGHPARVLVLGHGGHVLADRILGGEESSIEIVQGAERIAAMGQGDLVSDSSNAGLMGWHAGSQIPYVGWSTAIAPGCVVRSAGELLSQHRERVETGWVTGAELARGISTVTTTFAEAPQTVVIILDDPAAFGNQVGGRQLLLGLEGARRAQDASGADRAPALLVMENRSVLAYDIIPDGDKPIVVTIASELGWSLVGVMGSPTLNALGAIALISSLGFDAALRRSAGDSTPGKESRIEWWGETRTDEQRRNAKALASGRPLPSDKSTKRAKTRKGRGR